MQPDWKQLSVRTRNADQLTGSVNGCTSLSKRYFQTSHNTFCDNFGKGPLSKVHFEIEKGGAFLSEFDNHQSMVSIRYIKQKVDSLLIVHRPDR